MVRHVAHLLSEEVSAPEPAPACGLVTVAAAPGDAWHAAGPGHGVHLSSVPWRRRGCGYRDREPGCPGEVAALFDWTMRPAAVPPTQTVHAEATHAPVAAARACRGRVAPVV